MSTSLFKKIKFISQWEKDLVIGYSKEAQQLVKPNKIPIAISYLCLLFYYESDNFTTSTEDSTTTATTLKATDKVAKVFGNQILYSYLNTQFDKLPLLFEWTFKVKSKDDNDDNDNLKGCVIGITTAGEPSDIFEYEKSFNISNTGHIRVHVRMRNFGEYEYSVPFGYDDQVTMTYNNQNKIFKFKINGQCQGKAFNISTSNTGRKYEYKMAAQINAGDTIELTRFSKSLL